jgi:hypothetical protein
MLWSFVFYEHLYHEPSDRDSTAATTERPVAILEGQSTSIPAIVYSGSIALGSAHLPFESYTSGVENLSTMKAYGPK